MGQRRYLLFQRDTAYSKSMNAALNYVGFEVLEQWLRRFLPCGV
jgi:hypothetical protein